MPVWEWLQASYNLLCIHGQNLESRYFYDSVVSVEAYTVADAGGSISRNILRSVIQAPNKL